MAACADAQLARHNGVAVSGVVGGLAALITSASFSGLVDDRVLDAILMTAFLATAVVALSRWRGQHDVLRCGVGRLLRFLHRAASRRHDHAAEERGREALALLMLTIIGSDTAQFYTGRLFGRRLLAPRISPKKTIAGACGGFAAGIVLLAVVGAMWLPAVPLWQRIALGAAVVAFGIAGDLFESMLKRSAGLKDSSGSFPRRRARLDRRAAVCRAGVLHCAQILVAVTCSSPASESPMKCLAILGSTGSIGQSALAVVDAYPDKLRIVGLAAGENVERFAEQIERYRPRIVAMASEAALERLRGMSLGCTPVFAGGGRDGLVAVASHPEVDLVLCASSGTDGLEAVLAAIACGRASPWPTKKFS